ncbi:MAG: hypothetical protein RLO52_33850 [Sandaracinaceae bacterium]
MKIRITLLVLGLALPDPAAGQPDLETARAALEASRADAEDAAFALERGRYADAERLYRQLYVRLRGYPRRALLLHDIALCVEAQGRHGEALVLVRRYRREAGDLMTAHQRRRADDWIRRLTERVRRSAPAPNGPR